VDTGNVEILAAFERGLGGPFDGNAAKGGMVPHLALFYQVTQK
jgi:hypothetical protein